MSDAATPVNGGAPTKVRKAVAKTARAAPKMARKAARTVETEARSFAAEADQAREKLIATAIHRARARREYARRWALDRAAVAGVAVQSRPVTAIGFALGIGVIIGLLAAG
ncbi:MAG TPA: hypothetical protein VGL73_08565 [Caulobacteraceae bacterium]|jgi:ElaB/YqjD/DUF883 family membrane-anchored ribosome-binding protein